MLIKEKNLLKNKIQREEVQIKSDTNIISDSYTITRVINILTQRKRRTKNEIKRTYTCKIESCNKSYGYIIYNLQIRGFT